MALEVAAHAGVLKYGVLQVRDPAGRVYLRGSSKATTTAGTLTTAAAAAAQRVIGSSGVAIAATFHGGASSAADPQGPGPPPLHQVGPQASCTLAACTAIMHI